MCLYSGSVTNELRRDMRGVLRSSSDTSESGRVMRTIWLFINELGRVIKEGSDVSKI